MSTKSSAPPLCQDCASRPPVARVAREGGDGTIFWLCRRCVARAESTLATHGTIRPTVSPSGATKVFSGEDRPESCSHCCGAIPTRRIVRHGRKVVWLCTPCFTEAEAKFNQVGTIRPRAIGVTSNRSWTPDELEMLVVKMQGDEAAGGIRTARRKFFTKVFDKCFVGADLCDWLLDNFTVRERTEAVQVGRLLLANNYIGHVMDLFTFKDSTLLYKFIATDDEVPGGTPPFDMPIAELMTTHKVEVGRAVPTLVEACCAFVEEEGVAKEGIYRLSGSKADIDARRKLYNRGRLIVSDSSTDPHELAGFLKLWLRSTPDPVIPAAMYQEFATLVDPSASGASEDGASSEIGPTDPTVVKLKELVQRITPLYHRFTLNRVIGHLTKIAAAEEKNRMGAQNLAMVMGPNLLRPGKAGSSMDEFTALPKAVAVTYRLIVAYETIFDGVDEQEQAFVTSLMSKGQRRDLDPEEIARALRSPAVGPKSATRTDESVSVTGASLIDWLCERYSTPRDQALSTAAAMLLDGLLVGSTNAGSPDMDFVDDQSAVYTVQAQVSAQQRAGLRKMLSVKTSLQAGEVEL